MRGERASRFDKGLAVSASVHAALLVSTLRLPGVGRLPRHQRPTGLWTSTREGVVFLWRDKVLRAVAILTALLIGVWLPIEGVVLPYLYRELDSPARLGLLVTAMSAGGVVGALAYTAFASRFKRRTVYVVSLIGTAVPIVGMALLRKHGAVSLGAKVGESWRHGRYSGPYLRDVLLDEGYLVETFETATDWALLPALHDRLAGVVADALGSPGAPGPLVMAHISHVYETGASLYVTVVARGEEDLAAQWWRAKREVMNALVASGATITHHHAVGRDHAPWLPAEVGGVGIDVLRAVKATLDPAGILNPGVLLPPD